MEPAYRYKAKIKRIIDGDSLVVDFDLGLNVWLKDQHIRLYAINTPEIRGPERPEGLKAKMRLQTIADTAAEVIIETYKDKTGKYGRWLGTVWVRQLGQEKFADANQMLLDGGFAEPYNL